MAIKVYTGRMGSGKSYEVVTVVILGALRQGRRVVSNIAGLNFEEMRLVLLAEGVAESAIGSIVHVEHDDVTKRSFWKTDISAESFVQSGDLIALDEVWRFFDGFSRPPEFVLNFFRMHRHFVHEDSGHTCDVALITQDVNDIGKKIRPVIEETYHMEKHTALGAVRHYRVDVYSGAKKSRDVPVRSIQRTYNPEYYCFYQSHSQKSDNSADAVELNIDDRGNIFKSNFFKIGVPVALIALIFSVYHVVGFFTPKPQKPKTEIVPPVAPSASPSVPVSSSYLPAPVGGSAAAKFSSVLLTARPRIVYTGRFGDRSFTRIEFINGSEVVAVHSEESLYMHGWRIFYSSDGRMALLSNGVDLHHVDVEVKRSLSIPALMK